MAEEIIPVCQGCKLEPKDIWEYVEGATDCDLKVNDYVKMEEGTYNPENGHFLCTDCYIKAGMPALPYPQSWICP